MKKLYLHIGHGKTGSTSIQNYLDRNKNVLNEQGFFYCGINLNSLGKDFPWKESPWGFNSIPENSFTDTYFHEFQKYSDFASSLECNNLIMSNEGYADQIGKISQFIKMVANSGFEVDVIYYIRHPYDWMVSAYQQWGVKHKSYEGKIKPFHEFRHQGKDSPFEDTLKGLDELVNLKNINIRISKIEKAINNDVVEDFLMYLGVDRSGYFKLPSNEKLTLTEEAYYYIYNDSRKEVCLPVKAYQSQISMKDNTDSYVEYKEKIDPMINSVFLKEILERTNCLIEDAYLDKDIKRKGFVDYLTYNLMKNYLDIVDAVDVDRIRDLAVKLESINMEYSLELMELAHLFRPKGPRILKKINEYKNKIKEKKS